MTQNDMVDLMDKASEKIKKRQKQLENLPSWAFVNSRDIVHAKPDNLGREILKTVKLMYVKNGKDLTLYRYNLDNGLWELMTRSEEHTSELQSRFDLVYRLLLEKQNE